MKFFTLLLVVCILAVATPVALAGPTFEVGALVSDGKKSKETKSILDFGDTSFKVTAKGKGGLIKEFNYADITSADYSYSKKPLLSTGGAVAMAILTGLIVVPFLFAKKKEHWLSLRTANDYIVVRLDKDNYMQIRNEFEVHKVKVSTVDEDTKKEKEK